MKGVLAYVNPKGQTGFTPDPVAVLKNPPHPQAAQAYARFLLSVEGQAIWGLQVGKPGGPTRKALNRIPIRKDFYTKYEADLPPWLQNPFAEGVGMQVDSRIREVRYGVLAQLVRAAAIENLDMMKKARQVLKQNPDNQTLRQLFYALPENMDAEDDVFTVAEGLKDKVQADKILSGWIEFFRTNYKQIVNR